jgi:hypothetical protein
MLMPAGNQADAGMLNATLANNASGLRSVMDSIRRMWLAVGPLGADGLTEPPVNMAEADAEDYYAAASRMAVVMSVYFGDGTQAQAFDYDTELAAVRGPS